MTTTIPIDWSRIALEQLVRDELVDATVARVLEAADRRDLCVEAFCALGQANAKDVAAPLSVFMRSAFGEVELIVDGAGEVWMVESAGDDRAPTAMRLYAWHDADYLCSRCIDTLDGKRTFRPSVH